MVRETYIDDQISHQGGRGMTREEVLERIERARQKGLKKIDLSRRDISEIPAEIGSLTKLKYLYLRENKITTLPSEIGNLANLRRLDLRGNRIKLLPPEIGNLTNLIELFLSENQLMNIPREIDKLTNLTAIDIAHNRITKIPPHIFNLTKLKTIELTKNRITTIPPKISNLAKLQRLDLRLNQLRLLPTEIGSLTNLTTLELTGNRLTTIPPAIGNLTKLNRLDLRGNKLLKVSPTIGNLTSLVELDLAFNRLTTLPPEIGRLANLIFLDLEKNQIATLPPELSNLSKIRKIILIDNPIRIPDAIAKAGGEVLLAYLSERKEKQRERITIVFKRSIWGQLFPIEQALVRTLGKQYAIEKNASRIIVSLNSPRQLQDALDAVVPVLAALDDVTSGEIKSLEVEQRFQMPEKIAGKDLEESLREIDDKLTKLLNGDNKLTNIEKSGVDLAKGAPIIGNMISGWFERYLKRLKENPKRHFLMIDISARFKRFFSAVKDIQEIPRTGKPQRQIPYKPPSVDI